MAKATVKPKLDVKVTIELDYRECKALDAIAGYGDDAFIEAFREKLGAAYLRDYEDGLRRFLRTIGTAVTPAIRAVEESQRHLRGALSECRSENA